MHSLFDVNNSVFIFYESTKNANIDYAYTMLIGVAQKYSDALLSLYSLGGLQY